MSLFSIFKKDDSNYWEDNYFKSNDQKLMEISLVNGEKIKSYIYAVEQDSILVTKQGETREEDKVCIIYKNSIAIIEPLE